jgi:pimeloyl-ACP methyl ester carboxylesterase
MEATMWRARLDEVELGYEIHGSGDPVLLIHGVLVADALRPLVAEPAFENLKLIHYHRRGYGHSSRSPGPATTLDQAADAIGLIDHLDLGPVHVVGHSYGAMIALTLAASHPERVCSLALLEPPDLAGPDGLAFTDRVVSIAERYGHGDRVGAVHAYLGLLNPNWRTEISRAVPGGVGQAERDAPTFFGAEFAAITQWSFGAEEARPIRCPVLSVLGRHSSPMVHGGRHLLHRWFPHCDDVDVVGADHLLPMQHPQAVADAIARFVRTGQTSGDSSLGPEPSNVSRDEWSIRRTANSGGQ